MNASSPAAAPVEAAPPTQAYAAHPYQFPTRRPFIGLAQFTGARRGSNAVLRLKEQVDAAVGATKGLGVNATYEELQTALSQYYLYSPIDSVIMYRLTGNVMYVDQAIRMVDLFVKSETARIAAGSTPKVAEDSYLQVGQYLAELSLTYDHGYERLTPTQRSSWSEFADRAIENIWHPHKAIWGYVWRPWSGWSIDDPGNNYYYSFLKATQLWALASQSRTWLDFLQASKYPQLVAYFRLLPGGGSREGTGYGTALGNLFENYGYWKDSTGEDLAAQSSHARDTIDYWIHATVPTFEYFAPIGDQSRSSMPIMFDYQRKLMLLAVAANAGTAQALRGSWWLEHSKVTDGGDGWAVGKMDHGFNFRYDLLDSGTASRPPTTLSYDASGAGVVFARSDWTTAASWIHFVAGRYDQSHAHQDQGSFSFFKGTWQTVTANVFSHSGINQDTALQNVLRFDSDSKPIPQNHSTSSRTITDSRDRLLISADLSPAYSENAKRVSAWTRQFEYTRSTHSLLIHDLCSVSKGVTPVWQLQVPVKPIGQNDGSYVAGKLRITAQLPSAPLVQIVNMKEVAEDYGASYRLELRAPAGTCEFVVGLSAH